MERQRRRSRGVRRVRRVILESELPRTLIANNAGLGGATPEALISGQRNPSQESPAQIADGFEQREIRLLHLCDKIRTHLTSGFANQRVFRCTANYTVSGDPMDYQAAIQRVYDHLEDDHVDRAVMGCLRIARHIKDHLYTAIFLRELHPNKRELSRVIYDDTSHLADEAQKFLWETSLTYWLDTHTLGFSFGPDESGDERNILSVGVGEIDPELEQLERSIADLVLPTGMGEFDTAAFTDQNLTRKAEIRLRIKVLQTVKERIKARCLNYAIRIERQLEAQRKSQSFLEETQNEVNNYFKAHAEDVYTRLQKAAQLVDSNDSEDLSLLLTQVRRAMEAAADYFYPPSDQPVKCADGEERVLGNAEHLNRLHEFLATRLKKSSSRDLLRAELDHLAVFARRLNSVASKGVHATVSPSEAKQGLVGLYLFLFNVISRLDQKTI